MIEMFTKLLWAAIGAAAGYYVAKRQLHEHYEERLRKETEDARYFFEEKYEAKVKKARLEGAIQATGDMIADEEPEEVPASLLSEDAAEALTNYQGMSAPSSMAQDMGPVGNAIRQKAEEDKTPNEDEWDKSRKEHEVEKDATQPGPRLINFTMYDQNEPGHEQATVTYFGGDSEVADEHDKKLAKELVQKHIGYYNLEQLGDHRKTIYVRNDRYKMDFEIVWDDSSYAQIVTDQKG